MIQSHKIESIESQKPDCQRVIEVERLSRTFGTKQALKDVSFSVPEGVVVGLVGLNGAGKTTLLKHIMGSLRAQTGRVSVFGNDPSRNPVAVLSRIGYLTEEDSLPGWMTANQLLKFTKSFYPNWDDDYERELLDQFEIQPANRIEKMSKGQRARVGLTIAMAHRPELLVLDEPGSGLDPIVRQDILTAIIRTIADSGRTVLFSSHLLDEVQRVSDMIGLIRDGELVECGPLEELQTRYQRVTIELRDRDSMIPPPLDALGTWQRFGTEWSAIVGIEGDTFHEEVASIGGKIVDTHGVSLNEWFLNSAR